MAFGGDDGESADFGDAAGEFDVGAAAGHVGGDGDLACCRRPWRRFGFFGVADGVEDLVLEAEGGEHFAESFGSFDAAGADEDGLAGGVKALDFVRRWRDTWRLRW